MIVSIKGKYLSCVSFCKNYGLFSREIYMPNTDGE